MHNLKFDNISMDTMSYFVENVFPELQGRRVLCDLIWINLYSKDLVNTEALHTVMTNGGIFANRTPEISKLFLDYIENPIEE